jgi:beta-phosphoglucomutase-like phosphatase (HAD superfamily)
VLEHFDQVVTADDVSPGRTKPNPDLFLTALERLQVSKEAAVVFEDSPNGVKAANRAGIFVVAVPNSVTSSLSLNGADLILSSLSELPLSQLLDKVK